MANNENTRSGGVSGSSHDVVCRLGGSVEFLAQVRCGVVRDEPGYCEEDFVTPQYAVVYLAEGRGTYRDSTGTVYDLYPGTVYQRFPGVMHTVRMTVATRRFFVGVPRQVYELLRIAGAGNLDNPVLHPGLRPGVENEFQAIKTALRDGGRPELIDTMQRMMALILQLHRWSVSLSTDDGEPGGRGVPGWVDEVCRVLSTNLDKRLNMPDVARRFNLGYTTFRKQFAVWMQMPPGKFRMRRRVERAMEMLAERDLLVKEIASRLGYPNVFTFSAQFKKLTGVAPTLYRAQNR
jgi:AraC-like DNA-binding protein